MRDLRPLLVLAPAAAITGWLLALLLTFAATFTGCATAPSDGMVTVPRVPEWRIPTDTRVYSARDIYAAVVRHAPGADVSISDSTFTAVSHEWLQDAATWS